MAPLVAPIALKLPMTRMRSSTIINMAEMSVKAATIIINVRMIMTFMSSICSQAKNGRLFWWVDVTIEQAVAPVLHGALGQHGVEFIAVGVKVTGVFHVNGHMGAGVTMPPINALNDSDSADDIGIIKRLQIGLKHACNLQLPVLDVIVDEVGEHFVASMELQAVGDDLGYRYLVAGHSVGNIRHPTLNQSGIEVVEIITIIHTAHDNAHEILVGLEDGALVGNEADALDKAREPFVLNNRFPYLATIHRGVIIIKAKGGIGDLEVSIKMHDFSCNLSLEPHHDGKRENHDDHSKHNADERDSQAGRAFLPVTAQ